MLKFYMSPYLLGKVVQLIHLHIHKDQLHTESPPPPSSKLNSLYVNIHILKFLLCLFKKQYKNQEYRRTASTSSRASVKTHRQHHTYW